MRAALSELLPPGSYTSGRTDRPQGPLVTNEELVSISSMLGQTESALYESSRSRFQSGSSTSYRYDADGGDFDVTVRAADGFDSCLQVLMEALRRRNFVCSYYTVNDIKLSTFQKTERSGFILNVKEHWFCIRMLLTDQWFILDSLRPGPQEIEYGSLYSFVSSLLENKQGIALLVCPASMGEKLPVAEPTKYPKLESHQMYLTLQEIRQMNDQGNEYNVSVLCLRTKTPQEDTPSFLYRAGETKPKPVVWPTTGGIRLDQSTSAQIAIAPVKNDDEYKEADSRTVAVKLNGTARITRRFSPNSPIDDVFSWVEKNIQQSDVAFYTLLQTVPNRRFVKYLNGCIEIIEKNEAPREITRVSLAEAGFESQEMFILRCD
ncbi:josephin protein [Babesia caballi]|uniref:ubiquitinyl hydrolase 1 n=1 Tax=Babesia caballi TaxID=5871 RepID=A0AAV4LWN2_BABCB|nr:josephin protein [Babesia caballi]